MSVDPNHSHPSDTGNGAGGTVRDVSGSTIFAGGEFGQAHVVAHRMFDRGRFELGHLALGGWLDGRTGSGSEWVHLQFHMAVFELELGFWDDAFARFVEHVLPVAATTADALTDAPALAWRLWLAAGSPSRFPWEVVRRTAAARIELGDEPWVDLHNALALTGARDLEKLDRWLESRKRRARSSGERLAVRTGEALRDFAAGDASAAAKGLASAVSRLPEIGGSSAQNRLFEEIAAAAERRAGTDLRLSSLAAVA